MGSQSSELPKLTLLSPGAQPLLLTLKEAFQSGLRNVQNEEIGWPGNENEDTCHAGPQAISTPSQLIDPEIVSVTSSASSKETFLIQTPYHQAKCQDNRLRPSRSRFVCQEMQVISFGGQR